MTTQSTPRISVIIPCFNYDHFLDEALTSLESQTYRDWECIIIDDGSTDNTAEVARIRAERDSRFRYFHQAHRGLCAARNAGIAQSRGEFLQFLDADDFLASSKFETQLSRFEKEPQADIVYGNFCFTSPDASERWRWGKVRVRLKDDALGDLLANTGKNLMIPIHALLFRRSCFERWGWWDENLGTNEDGEIKIRFAALGARFACDDVIVAAYRKHGNSVAADPTNMRRGFLGLNLKLFACPQIPTRYKPLIAFRYGEEYFYALLQKLQGRQINLRHVFGPQPLGRNSHRVLLNAISFTLLPLFAFLKLCTMALVRIEFARGKNERIDCEPLA